MASLPTPGGDSGTWGGILNTFLEVSLDGTTGNMLPAAVAAAFTKLSTKTSNYSPGGSQGEFVLANATSGAITVTLPTAAGNIYYYGIKKVDSSSNTVTVGTTSSQTIDGGSTAVIKVQYASITLVSDGSNWSIV